MPKYKDYETDQYTAFLKQPYSNNYGISEERIADWFMSQAGARPVITSYGVNRSNLLSTYIPRLKQMLGGYVFFLCYTVTEGGGAGNWINHYASDTSTSGLQCLIDDCNYLLRISKENHPVAMSAPEVFQPAQEDVPGKAQQVYNSMSSNMIGKIFMPSTMAGNAWVYATQWCINNQGPQPYVYFGNPYDQIIRAIKSTGADPFKAGSQTPSSPDPNGKATRNVEKGDLFSQIAELVDGLKKGVSEIFDNQCYDLSTHSYYYTNRVIKVERTYNNTVKVSLDDEYLNTLFNSITELITKNNSGNQQSKTTKDKSSPQVGKPSGGQKTDIMAKVGAVRNLQGQKVGDGQCYALTSWYVTSISPGYNISKSLGPIPPGFAIGDILRAGNIGSGFNWSSIGWTVKEGRNENIRIGDIFNVASYAGGIWQTGEYGHTGVVTGLDDNNVEITDQNYNYGPVSIRQYPRSQFIQNITSLISPP